MGMPSFRLRDQGPSLCRLYGAGRGGSRCMAVVAVWNLWSGAGPGRKGLGIFGQHGAGAGDLDPSPGDPAGQSALHLTTPTSPRCGRPRSGRRRRPSCCRSVPRARSPRSGASSTTISIGDIAKMKSAARPSAATPSTRRGPARRRCCRAVRSSPSRPDKLVDRGARGRRARDHHGPRRRPRIPAPAGPHRKLAFPGAARHQGARQFQSQCRQGVAAARRARKARRGDGMCAPRSRR